MVTQKLISVRIDLNVLRMLDDETRVTGRPRNFMINRACLDYLNLIDIIRSCAVMRENIKDSTAFKNWLTTVQQKRYHGHYI